MAQREIELVRASQLVPGDLVLRDDPGILFESLRYQRVASVTTISHWTSIGMQGQLGLWTLGANKEVQRIVES